MSPVSDHPRVPPRYAGTAAARLAAHARWQAALDAVRGAATRKDPAGVTVVTLGLEEAFVDAFDAAKGVLRDREMWLPIERMAEAAGLRVSAVVASLTGDEEELDGS